MTEGLIYIDGAWQPGHGQAFDSRDPASGERLWTGRAATEADVEAAVTAARKGFDHWSRIDLKERIAMLEAYADVVEQNKTALAEAIARETGKPLWDATGEAGAVVKKVAISIQAYDERTPTAEAEASTGLRTRLTHRPHGVLAVFGPYNFPAHLPNGHIVPALLAGNSVVFKPSELTPMVGAAMVSYWEQAGLPAGVLNLVQGARETGMALSGHEGVDGILFTGSAATGAALHRQLGGRPEKILALEMGGNNPLVVADVADTEAAAVLTVQSAFISSGQRCTCARRLVVPEGAEGDRLIEALADVTDRIRLGAWDDPDEPFMGPVVSAEAADAVIAAARKLERSGGAVIRATEKDGRGPAFLRPGLMDVTAVDDRPDDEVFGPFLQIVRVGNFEAAIDEANNTRFGLAAGLLSDNAAHWRAFYDRVRAGIVNWNRPLPGAASNAPFGGIGLSGNHRPSAYYAADYCAWPVATMEAADGKVALDQLPTGITAQDGGRR